MGLHVAWQGAFRETCNNSPAQVVMEVSDLTFGGRKTRYGVVTISSVLSDL